MPTQHILWNCEREVKNEESPRDILLSILLLFHLKVVILGFLVMCFQLSLRPLLLEHQLNLGKVLDYLLLEKLVLVSEAQIPMRLVVPRKAVLKPYLPPPEVKLYKYYEAAVISKYISLIDIIFV